MIKNLVLILVVPILVFICNFGFANDGEVYSGGSLEHNSYVITKSELLRSINSLRLDIEHCTETATNEYCRESATNLRNASKLFIDKYKPELIALLSQVKDEQLKDQIQIDISETETLLHELSTVIQIQEQFYNN